MRWSDWLHSRIQRNHGIALDRLSRMLFEFLTQELGGLPQAVAKTLWRDYQRCGRTDVPVFLRNHLPERIAPLPRRPSGIRLKRQARRLASDDLKSFGDDQRAGLKMPGQKEVATGLSTAMEITAPPL